MNDLWRYDLMNTIWVHKNKLIRELGETGKVVEKIIDKRTRKRKVQYLVKHLNMPDNENEWYFISELEGAKDAIKEYEDKHSRKRRYRRKN